MKKPRMYLAALLLFKTYILILRFMLHLPFSPLPDMNTFYYHISRQAFYDGLMYIYIQALFTYIYYGIIMRFIFKFLHILAME